MGGGEVSIMFLQSNPPLCSTSSLSGLTQFPSVPPLHLCLLHAAPVSLTFLNTIYRDPQTKTTSFIPLLFLRSTFSALLCACSWFSHLILKDQQRLNSAPVPHLTPVGSVRGGCRCFDNDLTSNTCPRKKIPLGSAKLIVKYPRERRAKLAKKPELIFRDSNSIQSNCCVQVVTVQL